jgi:hypothetical protein
MPHSACSTRLNQDALVFTPWTRMVMLRTLTLDWVDCGDELP